MSSTSRGVTAPDDEREAQGESGGSYADVNGIKLYYEVHGTGRPLVALHGGLRRGVDVRSDHAGTHEGPSGHNRGSARPWSDGRHRPTYQRGAHGGRHRGANQVPQARPARHRGLLARCGVATFGAIRYPELIRKAVIISVNFTRKAIYPEMLAQQEQVGPQAAEAMKQTPMYQQYPSIAPRPEDRPRLLGKIGAAMKGDFDYSKEIATIKAPTMIVAGDSEMFAPSHAAEFFGLLGGGKQDGGWDGSGRPNSRLAILPGTTHYAILDAPGLPEMIIRFLDEPEPK